MESENNAESYKLKQIPEDFIVNEKLDLKFDDNGKYSYFLMKKKDYSTFDAIKTVAKYLKIKESMINAAGLKDRVAVTTQHLSINNGPRRDIELKDISLKYLGQGKERLSVGGLEGNNFEIVIRNIDSLPKEVKFVPNYFDSQRFGRDGDNHEIGRLIIKKDFKGAVEILKEKNVRRVVDFLEKNETNFVGALRMVPKKILQIYISAYQSSLWNKAVEKLLDEDVDNNSELSLPGFNLDIEGLEEVYIPIFREEGISLRDFIVRQIPEITTDGFPRKIFSEVIDLDIGELEDDDLNLGKKKVLVRFFLKTGNYATNAIRYMLS